ncbi:MAG: hypothetical protein ACREM2_08675 [Vulcanimicrobiaceae bacterium]
MIRANLLPRRSDRLSLFGATIERDLLRRLGIGLAVIVAVALLGIAIESLRLQRLGALAQREEAILAREAPLRRAAQRLAMEVAGYQEFAREAAATRASGAQAALAIARLGNAIPRDAWLDRLAADAGGFTVSGASRSVSAIGRTIVLLGRAFPAARAGVVSLDDRDRGPLRFTAEVVEVTPAPLDASTPR